MKKSTVKDPVKDLVVLSEIHQKVVPAISTLKISELYGKRHANVLTKTEDYIQRGKIDRLNFKPIYYKDSYGRDQKMYLLDERGYHFVVSGFTGKKAEAHRMMIIDLFMKFRPQADSPQKVTRMPYDDSAQLNKAVNEIYLHVRNALGKPTDKFDYINLAYAVNKCTFGEAGKNKKLRQSMDVYTHQCLNRNLSASIKGILNGAVEKEEIEAHLKTVAINPKILLKAKK